jgi:hypothetical protein
MRRLRALRNALVTVVAGALVGYAVVAFGTYIAGPGPVVENREPTDVHDFMETYLARVASDPESLTYLGGAISGGVGVHLYVVGLKDGDGRSVLAPIKLTYAGGRVIGIEVES